MLRAKSSYALLYLKIKPSLRKWCRLRKSQCQWCLLYRLPSLSYLRELRNLPKWAKLILTSVGQCSPVSRRWCWTWLRPSSMLIRRWKSRRRTINLITRLGLRSQWRRAHNHRNSLFLYHNQFLRQFVLLRWTSQKSTTFLSMRSRFMIINGPNRRIPTRSTYSILGTHEVSKITLTTRSQRLRSKRSGQWRRRSAQQRLFRHQRNRNRTRSHYKCRKRIPKGRRR